MKSFFVFLACLFLIGCNDKTTYTQTYLMQHPKELKRQVLFCQNINNKTSQENDYCQNVYAAANTFMMLLNQQQQSPQQFGQRILDAQMATVKLHAKIAELQGGSNAQDKQNSTSDVSLRLKQLHDEHQTLQDQIKIDLAIVGLNKPE